MALIDILNYSGETMIYEFNRGDLGIVNDMQSSNNVEELSATLGGGGGNNIFIMSE